MTNLESLKSAKVGQLVKIDDVDLLIELSDATKNPSPTFLVKDRTDLSDNHSSKVIFLTLDHVGTDIEYLLMVSEWNGEYDVKLFSSFDWFVPDSRTNLQKSEDTSWLFDGNDFPGEIYNEGVEPYVRKVQSEVYGSTVLVEYETASKIVNYRLLLIEEGFYNHNGGLVRFYQGRIIHPEHVSL